MSDFDFENSALAIKEAATAVFLEEVAMCEQAKQEGREKQLAGLWGWATSKVQNWAKVSEAFCDDVFPWEPLTLYLAAIEHDNPKAALRLARLNGWSATDLRHYLDKRAGVEVSKRYAIKERVRPFYDEVKGRMTLVMELPDRKPKQWDVTAREVIIG